MTEKQRYQIFITPEDEQNIKDKAAENGVSAGNFVVAAVNLWDICEQCNDEIWNQCFQDFKHQALLKACGPRDRLQRRDNESEINAAKRELDVALVRYHKAVKKIRDK